MTGSRMVDTFAEQLVKSYQASGDRQCGELAMKEGPRITLERFASGAYAIRSTANECWDIPLLQVTAERTAQLYGILLLAGAKALREIKGE